MASKSLLLRRLSRALKPPALPSPSFSRFHTSIRHGLLELSEIFRSDFDSHFSSVSRSFCSRPIRLKDNAQGPAAIDYRRMSFNTPNRQIWLSSPVSGPSRFDWDRDARTWVYRRTKANLSGVLETELEQLCGQCINLSSSHSHSAAVTFE